MPVAGRAESRHRGQDDWPKAQPASLVDRIADRIYRLLALPTLFYRSSLQVFRFSFCLRFTVVAFAAQMPLDARLQRRQFPRRVEE